MADIRDEITKSLTELGVDFPHTATIGQLRRLLRDVVGDGASNISITTDPTEIASQTDTATAAAADITEMVTTSAVVNAFKTPISTAVADTITTAATAVTAATNTIAVTTAANATAVTTAAAITAATTVAAVSNTTAATASFVHTAVDTNDNNNTINLAANPGATGINNIDNELTALRKRVEMLRLMKEIDDLGAVLAHHNNNDD